MVVLEERIAEILKMRLQGKNENEVAESLGIPLPDLISAEEKAARLIIDSVGRGMRGLQEISQETNLPNFVVSVYASHRDVDIYGGTINRPSVKQRLEAIRYAVQLGAASIDEIANAVGLHRGTVYTYSSIAGIDLPKSVHKQSQEKRFAAIRQAVEAGANSVEEVAELADLAITTVRQYAWKAGIKLPKQARNDGTYVDRLPITSRVESIKVAINGGAQSVDEIAEQIGLSPTTVRQYSYNAGIRLPRASHRESVQKTERIEAIREAVASGLTYIEDVAERIGLARSTTRQYALKAGIKLSSREPYKKITLTIQEGIEKIKLAVAGELATVQDVAERAGLSVKNAIIYARKARIDLPAKVYRDDPKVYQRRYNREERLVAINQALAEGVNSLEELCKRTHLKPVGLWKFCNDNSLTLPSDLIPFKYNPDLDTLIEQGISLPEMGARAQHTREGVRQYINYSGQYNLWRAARQSVKNANKGELQKREGIYRELLSVLEARKTQLVQNESWVVQMALKHERSIQSRPNNVPYQKVVRIFERYDKAQRRGKKVSLEELGKNIVSSAAHVGRILERVGVEPMYGSRPESPRYKEKKKTVERLAQMGIPNGDIAYFVDLPEHIPQQHFARRNIKNTAEAFIFNSRLTYRLASQIYEAQDLGFNPNEIAQLLNTRQKVVDYATENRASIKKPIVKALRIVYSDKKHNAPYKK